MGNLVLAISQDFVEARRMIGHAGLRFGVENSIAGGLCDQCVTLFAFAERRGGGFGGLLGGEQPRFGFVAFGHIAINGGEAQQFSAGVFDGRKDDGDWD